MMRPRGAIIAFISVLPFCVGAENTSILTGLAEVSADRLEILHKKQRAQFFGHVHVTWNELAVDCDKMDVAYGDKGNIVSLVASGHLVVRWGEARATAESARLDAGHDLLVLEGNTVLHRGAHQLAGQRIVVYLVDQRVEIVGARASFRLADGAAQ